MVSNKEIYQEGFDFYIKNFIDNSEPTGFGLIICPYKAPADPKHFRPTDSLDYFDYQHGFVDAYFTHLVKLGRLEARKE